MKKYINLYLISILFIYAGIAHFTNPQFYINITPSFIPFKQFLVDLTGVLEILGGLLVLFNTTRKTAVYLLLGLLILFFIVHLDMLFTYEVSENIILNKSLLLIRIIIQILLIVWVKSLIKLFPYK
ncbi:hypothetical protein N8376_01125 [Flavobacteriaceae bacterium]|nr:hypothetical protein [Flavobacteriaceae bacterium]MDC1491944.1 hypothetical protein [Flavobacteriaceae bacterium]